MRLSVKLRDIKAPLALSVFLAIALQIQITLFQSETYAGLRLNLADPFLPLIGLAILFSLLRKTSQWPTWQHPSGYWIPILLTVIMTAALANGYMVQGELSSWSLVNKYIGWFVVMAYFAAGAWLGSNLNAAQIGQYFYRPFLLFCGLILALFISLYFLSYIPGIKNYIFEQPMYIEGLMANRNAYGFLVSALICFVFIYQKTKNSKISSALLFIFWTCAPLFVIFNSGRSLYLCVFLLLPFLLWKRKHVGFDSFLKALALGGVLVSAFLALPQENKQYAWTFKSTEALVNYAQDDVDKETLYAMKGSGTMERITVLEGAWKLIKQYPIQGAGLGSTLYFQKLEHGKRINVIDSSPVWILTEMGIIGVLAFGAAYIAMALSLRRRLEHAQTQDEKNIIYCAAMLMLCFSVYCLFHELLYTRFFWFILGLSLVIPLKTHPQKSEV